MLLYLNVLIPVVLKAIFPDGRYGIFTLAVDFLILPISLIILNIYLIQSRLENSISKCFIFMLVGLLLGTAVGYAIWGISNKTFMAPDSETLMIFQKILIYHIAVCVLFAGVYKAILMISNK